MPFEGQPVHLTDVQRDDLGETARSNALPAGFGDRRVTKRRQADASPRLDTVRLILRQQEADPPPVCPPVTGVRPDLARIAVPAPRLSAYDALVEGAR